MINLTEFAKEVHENSVAHGWWEKDREYYELVALFHCEISEAMEEYRAGRSMVWYACEQEHDICNSDVMSCLYEQENKQCCFRSKKPEGIAVELVDLVLRILDYLGKEGIDVKKEIRRYECSEDSLENFSKFVTDLHGMISNSYSEYYFDERFGIDPDSDHTDLLLSTISMVMYWFEQKGIDFEEVLLLKHEYNKTRPYKHGGKLL